MKVFDAMGLQENLLRGNHSYGEFHIYWSYVSVIYVIKLRVYDTSLVITGSEKPSAIQQMGIISFT